MKKSSKFLNGLMGFIVVVSIIVVALVFIVPKQFEEYVNDETKLIQDKEELENENSDSVIDENNDKRILVTPGNIFRYNNSSNPKCFETFNQDLPNKTVRYEDKEKGISIEIPFNSVWGNETYRVKPYDSWHDESGKEYLVFGPLASFEACSWVRNYALYFEPVRSADFLIEEMKKTPDYSEIFIVKPTKKIINGFDVVESQSQGLCDNGQIEVVGNKYNYIIRPLCGADFEFLESVVKSIRFIESSDDTKIDLSGLKNYKLDCTDKPDSFQSKYSWFNRFREKAIENLSLDAICYNVELNKAVYLKSKIDWKNYVYDSSRKSYGFSQVGIYDIEKDEFDEGPNRDLGFYEGCGIITEWIENNEIIYQCGSGDAGVGITRTFSYNTINKTIHSIEECNIQVGREPEKICSKS